MVDIFKLDYSQSAALRLGKLEIDFALIVGRRLDFVHPLDLPSVCFAACDALVFFARKRFTKS